MKRKVVFQCLSVCCMLAKLSFWWTLSDASSAERYKHHIASLPFGFKKWGTSFCTVSFPDLAHRRQATRPRVAYMHVQCTHGKQSSHGGPWLHHCIFNCNEEQPAISRFRHVVIFFFAAFPARHLNQCFMFWLGLVDGLCPGAAFSLRACDAGTRSCT